MGGGGGGWKGGLVGGVLSGGGGLKRDLSVRYYIRGGWQWPKATCVADIPRMNRGVWGQTHPEKF